jgi:hypothetical protein
MSAPETASFSEFARLAGFRPSYVTQLKRDGRLILTGDGKAVRVVESMARIKATADPARVDVAARHAAAREPAQSGAAALPPAAGNPDADRIGSTYQAARAVGERYRAMAAKRDYEISIGKLLDADAVRSAVADATVALRTRLESLPTMLGPLVAAEADESRCTALLADSIGHALDELSRQFRTITPETAK